MVHKVEMKCLQVRQSKADPVTSAKKLLIRRAALFVICVALAIFLAKHSMSSVLYRVDPQTAITLSPNSGLAWERYALLQFSTTAQTEEEVADLRTRRTAAQSAQSSALRAIEADPLAPKAHAFLAMIMDDEKRSELLMQASLLNRRETLLQSIVLEQAAEDGDTEKVLKTLDQILRVRPNIRPNLDSMLVAALLTPEGESTFPRFVDGSSPWHRDFLVSAAQIPKAQPVLASLREDLFIDDVWFDKFLIAGLAEQGELDDAQRVYDFLTTKQRATSNSATLSWSGQYPPFDWKFVGRNEFRAQPSRDQQRLEVFVRAGQGGVVAQRILRDTKSEDALEFTVNGLRQLDSRNNRIQFRCKGASEAFFKAELSDGEHKIFVPKSPAGCNALILELYIRVMTGEPTLRAEFSEIRTR